ncbi:MAG: VOC family protein [Beijerinckiaceae bacterium]|nr:VOC family protein [Beijerinckiaceae bacterium]
MIARLAYFNLLARDVDALCGFYARVFEFAEIEGHRSPIYRCLEAGGVELGFNAQLAYELLNLAHRKPAGAQAEPTPVAAYITFELDSAEAIDATMRKALAHGARLLKEPYDTYYNARQCVLEDPEGNVLRLNYRKGPRKPAHEVDSPPWPGAT